MRIGDSGADVVAVIAGAGYGKTTLLREMAEHDPRPVVWLSLDVRDDDPAVLLSDLVVALDRVVPLEPGLLQRLTKTGSRVSTSRMRELTRWIERLEEPLLFVLDDVHLLASHGALDVVSMLIEHVPGRSMIAFAARRVPDLSLPRLRAAGRLLELGAGDLALDEDETGRLVRGVGLDLPDSAVSLINRRTEGWAAAIYLATVSIREHDDPAEAASAFTGDHRLIAEYVRDELLRGVPARHLRFMRRTSILHVLTPGLCDTVAGSKGSAALLAELERSSPFVVPMVDHPDRYRYHQLFRDVLASELRRSEPDLIPDLYRKASAWSEANGVPDDAIVYSQEGGHVEDAARVVCEIARLYVGTGRIETVGRWLAWFDEAAMLSYPPLAVVAAWCHAFAGDADPVRWLRLAEAGSFGGPMPDGSSSFDAAVALVRAALCQEGPERMQADVDLAAECGSPASDWRVLYWVVAGEAALLRGDIDGARGLFHEAVELAGPTQPGGHAMALSELAAIAAEAGAWDEAGRLVDRARVIAGATGLDDMLLQPLIFAVSALVRARYGDPDGARRDLIEAQKLRATSSFAIPSFSIRGRLEMARAYLALGDVEGARTVLAEARSFQSRRPNIGTLADALDEVEDEIRRMRGSGVSGPTTLSAAELRVLVLLPTHLSFRQIGERLFVSNNTVKSHAMSIYHKLGVSSRSEAVERAVELGLLDR